MRLVLTLPALENGDEPRRVPLRDEGIDVGGASDCEALVDHPSVGTTRVRIERRGEHWVVIDRDGRGACSVGGVALRAREPRLVRPPHTLTLGDVELALEFDANDPSDVATREVALRMVDFVQEVAPRVPRVRVVEGPRMGETMELSHAGPYRVGRAESCDLFLDSESASREHFSVEREGDRIVVRDLGSATGTFLGRSRLEPRRGAVWNPSRMVRAADAVFALEVATAERMQMLMEPLGSASPATTAKPPPESIQPKTPPPAAPPSELVAQPQTSAEGALLSDVPRALDGPPHPEAHDRTRRRFFLILAVVAALAGVAALALIVALLLS